MKSVPLELIKCSYCDQDIDRKRMEHHMYTKHKDVKMHICDQCPFKTNSLINLTRHIDNMHLAIKWVFRYFDIFVFQYFTFSVLQFYDISMLRYFDISILRYFDISMKKIFRWFDFLTFQFYDIPILQYSNYFFQYVALSRMSFAMWFTSRIA